MQVSMYNIDQKSQDMYSIAASAYHSVYAYPWSHVSSFPLLTTASLREYDNF